MVEYIFDETRKTRIHAVSATEPLMADSAQIGALVRMFPLDDGYLILLFQHSDDTTLMAVLMHHDGSSGLLQERDRITIDMHPYFSRPQAFASGPNFAAFVNFGSADWNTVPDWSSIDPRYDGQVQVIGRSGNSLVLGGREHLVPEHRAGVLNVPLTDEDGNDVDHDGEYALLYPYYYPAMCMASDNVGVAFFNLDSNNYVSGDYPNWLGRRAFRVESDFSVTVSSQWDLGGFIPDGEDPYGGSWGYYHIPVAGAPLGDDQHVAMYSLSAGHTIGWVGVYRINDDLSTTEVVRDQIHPHVGNDKYVVDFYAQTSGQGAGKAMICAMTDPTGEDPDNVYDWATYIPVTTDGIGQSTHFYNSFDLYGELPETPGYPLRDPLVLSGTAGFDFDPPRRSPKPGRHVNHYMAQGSDPDGVYRYGFGIIEWDVSTDGAVIEVGRVTGVFPNDLAGSSGYLSRVVRQYEVWDNRWSLLACAASTSADSVDIFLIERIEATYTPRSINARSGGPRVHFVRPGRHQ